MILLDLGGLWPHLSACGDKTSSTLAREMVDEFIGRTLGLDHKAAALKSKNHLFIVGLGELELQ